MKLYFLLTLISVLSFKAIAQEDTSAYEAQRKIVNSMLDNRSAKFGQYDESLIKRTGIFGLKTKKDMQRSIDILTDIVRTDNTIFKQLKILLDYKNLEKTQVKDRFVETEDRSVNFIAAINKLQQQNEKLKSDLLRSEKRFDLLIGILVPLALIISGIVYYLYRTKKLTFN